MVSLIHYVTPMNWDSNRGMDSPGSGGSGFGLAFVPFAVCFVDFVDRLVVNS